MTSKPVPQQIQIKRLESTERLPFHLLLLADETIEAIEKYIYDSEVYVLTDGRHKMPIGVFALYKISDFIVEIKNIAISKSFQRRGIGSNVIDEIKRIATLQKYNAVIVGTPDCAAQQINFYEKNGFEKYDVRKDFFLTNYHTPIFQDGIMLRDMTMLKLYIGPDAEDALPLTN